MDTVQVKGRIALAEGNLHTEQNDYRDNEIAYMRVTGRMPRNIIYPHLDQSRLPNSKNNAIRFAVDHHPRLISANHDIEATIAQNRAAKSPFYPHIDAVLSANRNDNIDGVRGINHDNSAVLQATWNLFNGGTDLARVRETAFFIEQAAEVRNRTFREVIESTGLSWVAYQTNRKLMDDFNRHMRAAKATAEAYAEQFKLGQRTLLDLLDQENEFFNASRSYINAKYDYVFAKYRIYNSMGILLYMVGLSPAPEAHGCMLPLGMKLATKVHPGKLMPVNHMEKKK